MKKWTRLLVVVSMILGLTGCIKYDVSMEINKDKSMNLKVIYAINKEQMENTLSDLDDSFSTTDDIDDSFDFEDADNALDSSLYDEEYDYSNITEDDNLLDESILDTDLEESDSELSDDDFTEMISTAEELLGKRGYKISEYTENGYQGFSAVLSIDNIDNVSVEKELIVEMSEILEEDFNDKELFTVKKGFFKNTYTANYVYTVNSDEADSSAGALYGSMFDFNYSVKIPYNVKSDNADSHDGDLLNWKVSLDKDTNIQFSFDIPNTTNIIIVVAGLLLVLVLVILIVNLVKKRKNKTNIGQTSEDVYSNLNNNETFNNIDY